MPKSKEEGRSRKYNVKLFVEEFEDVILWNPLNVCDTLFWANMIVVINTIVAFNKIEMNQN